MGDQVTRTIIVKADLSRVYDTWANFENFPNFMENIEEVECRGDNISHWTMSGPMGISLEWEAETTLMEENKRIGWNTKGRDDNDVTTSGMVTFTELPKGETQITVTVQYEPKAGLAGDVVERLFANPEKQLEEDLQNFKSYVEGMQGRTAGG